jgi:hypothetical protein
MRRMLEKRCEHHASPPSRAARHEGIVWLCACPRASSCVYGICFDPVERDHLLQTCDECYNILNVPESLPEASALHKPGRMKTCKYRLLGTAAHPGTFGSARRTDARPHWSKDEHGKDAFCRACGRDQDNWLEWTAEEKARLVLPAFRCSMRIPCARRCRADGRLS